MALHISKESKDKKIKCLKFIMGCYENMHGRIDSGIDPNYNNINIAHQITNIIFRIFTILRERANGTNGNAEKKLAVKKMFNLTSKIIKYTIQFEVVEKVLLEETKTFGLDFKKFDPNSQENWYGTVAPYLDFFAANTLRFNELTYSNMPVQKDGDNSKSFLWKNMDSMAAIIYFLRVALILLRNEGPWLKV